MRNRKVIQTTISLRFRAQGKLVVRKRGGGRQDRQETRLTGAAFLNRKDKGRSHQATERK